MQKKIIALAIAALLSCSAWAGQLVDSQGSPVVDSQGQVITTHDDPAQCPSCYQGA